MDLSEYLSPSCCEVLIHFSPGYRSNLMFKIIRAKHCTYNQYCCNFIFLLIKWMLIMIGYTCLGTNDLEKNAKFYDSLFTQVGAKRVMEDETFILWSTGLGSPGFSLIKPFDGNVATVGNGTMVAIALETPDQVDAFYSKAIELGAKDEGAAGPRTEGFYAGFFRDLDGNKLNCFCSTS